MMPCMRKRCLPIVGAVVFITVVSLFGVFTVGTYSKGLVRDQDTLDREVLKHSTDIYGNIEHVIVKTLDAKIESLSKVLSNVSVHFRESSLREKVNIQRSIIEFLSQPIRNEHNFSYLHNPERTCRQSLVKLLNVVPSALRNFDLRNKLRSGKRFYFINNTSNYARMLFFLGTTHNETLLEQINKEAKKFGDIVQENYMDTYKNIRHKAMSMLKWAVTFCPGTQYVLRTDDDIDVNLEKIVDAMKMTSQKMENFILAKTKKNEGPVRNKHWKVYISEEEYPNSTYPTFGLGGLLGYPMGTVRLLYQAALRVKPIWLDDVFITALCAPKVNVTLLEHPAFTFKH
ncbi:beta-1,3-galactosyltransferase 5-like [Physella acuta]|uniref:beta-1,3-galactosyltransferase 5-like n=1 Tax=Physella acuta TaxID=109671 RepID=UPI0027DE1EB9|nr:beta-1,3-galactosyltransferase 5-like [Physella acuta]